MLALAHWTDEAHCGAVGDDETLDQVGSPERLGGSEWHGGEDRDAVAPY